MEEHKGRPVVVAVFAGSLVAFTFISSSTCGGRAPAPVEARDTGAIVDAAPDVREAKGTADAGSPAGLSAPIAAVHLADGDVVVAALDVASKAIRLQRVGDDETVKVERVVLDDVAWSPDADLKVFAFGEGVVVTWRGLRGGKLVRAMVTTRADLTPAADPTEISGGSCVTQDAFFTTDGRRVTSRPRAGASTRVDLPKDEDATLICAAHRAFALLEEEEKTTLYVVGGTATGDAGVDDGGSQWGDGGALAEGGTRPQAGRFPLLEEAAFGEDDQRELAEYTVGDDIGVVRLGVNGTLALRELRGTTLGALHKLKTTIPRDDDVVAADASAKYAVVVYTQDVSETCTEGGGATKVIALRVDRATHEEATFELSAGLCGREVGPFFTGAVGDSVSVAWVERASVKTKEKAPITGLAHRAIGAAGMVAELRRIDQPADALAEAGCDDKRCYAVALARRPGADVMVPGFARVIRYP